MSVLRDLAQPAARHLRFSRPVQMPVAAQRPVYLYGDGNIPVPPSLAEYVRGSAHFAHVLATVTDGVTHHRLSGARYEAAITMFRLLGDDLYDERAAALLLLLMPPVPCGRCGRLMFKDTERRLFCSDRCRRLYQESNHGQHIPAVHPPCVVCGATLPTRRLRYCGDVCVETAERERRNGR